MKYLYFRKTTVRNYIIFIIYYSLFNIHYRNSNHYKIVFYLGEYISMMYIHAVKMFSKILSSYSISTPCSSVLITFIDKRNYNYYDCHICILFTVDKRCPILCWIMLYMSSEDNYNQYDNKYFYFCDNLRN